MINVLYVTFASKNFDGATYSLMDLIRSVRSHVYPIVLLRSKGCVYDYFKENNVECIVCDFEEDLCGKPRKIHQYVKYILRYIPKYIRYVVKNRKCVRFVADQLKDRNIQIVHTNNSVLTVGYDIAQRMHAKHVWHLRGFMDLDFGWMPFRGWKNLKQLVSNSSAAIGITKAVLEHYIASNRANAYAVFDAVRSKQDICYNPLKEKYFLFCSVFLTKRKGCEFAIKAFALSNLAAKGYRLRVIGVANEKYQNKLHRLVCECGVSDYVDFIGQTDNVKDHMQKATAFLMCSENEGLGRVSIEAMFYGCLVIGRNSGGTKEFIINKKTGFLFDNINECSQAMQLAAGDDVTGIIIRAQDFARDHFSIENYGEKILKIYAKVLNKNL